jgi:hypothetical protein
VTPRGPHLSTDGLIPPAAGTNLYPLPSMALLLSFAVAALLPSPRMFAAPHAHPRVVVSLVDGGDSPFHEQQPNEQQPQPSRKRRHRAFLTTAHTSRQLARIREQQYELQRLSSQLDRAAAAVQPPATHGEQAVRAAVKNSRQNCTRMKRHTRPPPSGSSSGTGSW